MIDETKNLIDEYVASIWQDDPKMQAYVKKNLLGVVVLDDGGMIGEHKKDIEKRFCFADEGVQYEQYKELIADDEKMKKYFFRENLAGIEKEIDVLKNWLAGVKETDGRDWLPWVYYDYYNHKRGTFGIKNFSDTWNNCTKKYEYENDRGRILNKDEGGRVLALLEQVKNDLERRLEAWWKRYGAKKLKVWTYWADR